MSTLSRHYPDWKAPAEDGRILLWPEPAELLADIAQNRQLLDGATAVRIQHVPLPQLRQRMRQFIGHDHERPLVVTGHQIELHHPGVWVKNIVINDIAARTGGCALHVAIDTDSPKHLALRWPGQALPISDDPQLTAAAWSGLVDAPTPAHLITLRDELAAASRHWQFAPVAGEVLESLKRLSLEAPNLPSALSNAMHELDWRLGLKHHLVLSSPIWMSAPYHVFAHDLLANAGELSKRYNAALAAYRLEQGIKSATRPMPDLPTSADEVEAPFWLDDLRRGARRRATLHRQDDRWSLRLEGGNTFTFDPRGDGWEAAQSLQRWLTAAELRLTPRALTQMLFLRLVLADQFVHGIGGGRYDQVTDRLIAAQYDLEPPKFAVTTATLFFPDALGRQRVCISCIKQRGHRLRHGLLGQRKRELVREIQSLPRHSPQRTNRFYQMHAELTAAAAESGVLERWQQEFRESQQREKQEQTLFDRELFYALQSESRLSEMIDRYRALIG